MFKYDELSDDERRVLLQYDEPTKILFTNFKRMNKIQFSHRYFKLWREADVVKFARLLQVFKCHYKDLGKSFIKLDTLYWEKGAKYSNPSYYKLPKTELMVLFFVDIHNDKLFTTIRKYTPKKYEYYKSKMGESFKVIIKEE